MFYATCIVGRSILAMRDYCPSRFCSAINHARKNKQTANMSSKTNPLLLVLTVTWLTGCATSTPSPPATPASSGPPEYCSIDYQAQLQEIRRVALVTGSEPPIVEAKIPGLTRGEGAAAGAAGGAALGAAGGLSTLPASLACGPLAWVCVGGTLALTGVLAVGGAVVGGVAGVASGYSADTIAEAEANTQAMLDSVNLQTEVLQRAQNYGHANFDLKFIPLPSASQESRVGGQAYTGLPDESIDAVLEVELLRISLQKSLEMESRTRLVSSITGDVLSENKQLFLSEPHSLEEWTENNEAQLSETIQQGLTMLTEDMINDSFPSYLAESRPEYRDPLASYVLYSSGYYSGPELIDRLKGLCQAAEVGSASSQAEVGLFYKDGLQGVNQDLTKAYLWYARANKQIPFMWQDELNEIRQKAPSVQKLSSLEGNASDMQGGQCERDFIPKSALN